MVRNRKKHTPKTPAKQGAEPVIPQPMKIGAATPYDFQGSNLTPYGGLLPVVTMLEKLHFRELIERHVTITRLTPSMPGFRFVLAMILALSVADLCPNSRFSIARRSIRHHGLSVECSDKPA